MAEKAVDMLHRAMTTFANEDLQTAKIIIQEDDVIDECYTQLYFEAIHNILGDPRNIERVNYVIWAAHNLERLGDRATNICERVIFIVTGERPELAPMPREFRLSLKRTIMLLSAIDGVKRHKKVAMWMNPAVNTIENIRMLVTSAGCFSKGHLEKKTISRPRKLRVLKHVATALMSIACAVATSGTGAINDDLLIDRAPNQWNRNRDHQRGGGGPPHPFGSGSCARSQE
jgi:hypothetical protein